MFPYLTHLTLFTFPPIIVAWGLHFEWWQILGLAVLFFAVAFACPTTALGVVVWCIESIQDHSDRLPIRIIVMTVFTLGVIAGGFALFFGGLSILGIIVLGTLLVSWFIVTLRARTGASRKQAILPAVLAVGYWYLVWSRMGGGYVPPLVLIPMVLSVIPPLISPRLAMLLGVLHAIALGVMYLLARMLV